MPRHSRFLDASEGNAYHVTARGSGRRVIFEDDSDRKSYLRSLRELVNETDGSLFALCLMDNHVHLLFHMELRELSTLLQRLQTGYALRFNGRHGHVGPVFQGRYSSTPVTSDEQLAATVKYIHRNPKDIDGADWRNYPWSSYREYTDGADLCETETVLSLFDGIGGFIAYHEDGEEVDMVRLGGHGRRLSDADAVQILEERLGTQYSDTLATLPTGDRDRELAVLLDFGLSARQVERLTGIGRNIVNRAGHKR